MLSFWDLIFPILSRPLNVDAPDLLDLPDNLFPFQIDGIKRLLANKSFLLADEMGTGKSSQTYRHALRICGGKSLRGSGQIFHQ